MTDSELIAYSAGILDGEGCITTKWPRRKQIAVEVKMVSKPAVERFALATGGRCVPGYERRHGRFPQWQCRLYDGKAWNALTAMLPFLCEKRKQAELAIAFRVADSDEERNRLNSELKQQKLISY